MRWLAGLVIVLVSMLLSVEPIAKGQVASNSDAVPASAYLTEFLANSTIAPLRDSYAVYSRLKAVPPTDKRSIDKPIYQLGDQETFNVFDVSRKLNYKVTATLYALTPHVYMFADKSLSYNQPTLTNLANQFEQKIYPTTRRYFGEEASPGVDNDPHLVILNTPLSAVAGYFSSDDTQLKSINPNSNEREMFYIGVNPANTDGYLGTLAHEFQHMVYQHTLPNQDLWLNEGSSVLSQILNGYSTSGYENSFFSRPSTQLNTWACSTCGTSRYYGAGYTWLAFLQSQFGIEVIQRIAQNNKGLTGFNGVDYGLLPYNQTVDNVFKQFVATNYLNKRSADPAYNYQNITSRIDRINSLAFNDPQEVQSFQYSADYYNVTGGNFVLDFKGATTVRLAGSGSHSGQQAWWSNRGDLTNSTLTRKVDLSSIKQATLKFWTWFDIEASFDWLYVEVSTDEGRTWQILPGSKYTSTDDPIGKSFGAGFTGQSVAKGLDLSDSGDSRSIWVQESYDLAKFAGQKILLRLEYLTDEGYNRQGALFDDFEISEIGWKDDVEQSENGWEASGFLRSDLQIPQRFWVQVIRRDGACGLVSTKNLSTANDNGKPCIEQVLLDSNNAGQHRFDYKEAVIVVSPYAVKTLNPTNYRLKISAAN